ncbi:MAG TPA: ATP-dependent zinc metalloprotease FtsH [Anaeromyxobacteraceae bacterium]|nr:ATP-dependent zinc metalloprotease FtsH [Anaeromyxobacteraceae bacterium]
MTTKTRFNLAYALIAALGVLTVHDLWSARRAVATIPYSEFQRLLRERKVAEVWIAPDSVHGQLQEPLPGGQRRFTAVRVDRDLASDLAASGVKFSGRLESTLLPTLLSWIVPALAFLGIWMFLARRVGSRLGGGAGLMAIGKSKAKVLVEARTGVAFRDVAGVDEAKQELEEVVRFLREPKAYGRLGARMPKGVLLVGPPGTGKTLLARAVAGEAGVPFFSISGSEFVEMFVGVGAARVRDLFEQARGKAPCIIFIDELDALGRARGAPGVPGGHDEKEQTLNQLLVELDGFDPTSGIVLLAATNRPEVLDPALLRAGRFDRQVLVDRPDRRGRIDILAVHLARIRADEALRAEDVAALTPGFTGADLANVVNEAALVATRRGGERVTLADFTAAIERIVAGLERRNRLLGSREREIVAHHEMGHALVAASLRHADPVHKISIIPRGIGALGYTLQRPSEDRYLDTKEQLEARLAVLMGGRAAEEIVFGHRSTGAADDLARSTAMARAMATRYAMVPELGAMSYDSGAEGFLGAAAARREHAPETAREVDRAVRDVLDRAYARARAILERNRDVLDAGARALLEKETLDEADLEALRQRLRGTDRAELAQAGAAA